MSEEESLVFFDSICKNNNEEYNNVLTTIMLRSMLCDFEQNIFRLKIRDFSNADKIQIWTFYNNSDEVYSDMSKMIERRYSEYGAKFEYEDAPQELLIEKVVDRKPANGKNMTNTQKIINWYGSQPSGREFKINEMLTEIDITSKQYEKAKKNKAVSEIFIKSATSRKGYYKIVA